MPSISIRDATAHDAPTIVANNLAMAWETETLRLDEAVLKAGVERVLQGDVGARYWLACDGDTVVGQLMITTEWSDWRNAWVWWIQSVYTSPDGRGKGVYRALYEHVRDQAQAQHVTGIRLYVDTRNTTAQAVYTKLGMEGEHYRVFEAMF
jgi:GNAT superfamily N-acetyltransferase